MIVSNTAQFCDWAGWAYRVAADEHRATVAAGRAITLGRVTGRRTTHGASVADLLNRQEHRRCRYMLAQQHARDHRDEQPSATSRDITHAVTPTRGAPPGPALSLGPPNGCGDPTKCESAGAANSDALFPLIRRPGEDQEYFRVPRYTAPR